MTATDSSAADKKKKPSGLSKSRDMTEAVQSQALEEMKKIVLPSEGVENELQELLAVFAAAKEAEESGDDENTILLTRATIHECDRLLKSNCAAAIEKPVFYFVYATALFDLVLSDIGQDENDQDLNGFLELAEQMVNKGLDLDSSFGDLYVIGTEIALQQGFVELIHQDQEEEVSKAAEKVLAIVRRFSTSTVEEKHTYFLEIATSIAMHLDDYAEYQKLVETVCSAIMEIGEQVYSTATQRDKSVFLLEFGSVLSKFFIEEEGDEEEEWEDEEEDLSEENVEDAEEDIEVSDTDSVKESLAMERQMFANLARKFIDTAINNITECVESDQDAKSKGSSLIMLIEAYVLRGNLDMDNGQSDYTKAIEKYELCKQVYPDVITEEIEEAIQELKEEFQA